MDSIMRSIEPRFKWWSINVIKRYTCSFSANSCNLNVNIPLNNATFNDYDLTLCNGVDGSKTMVIIFHTGIHNSKSTLIIFN